MEYGPAATTKKVETQVRVTLRNLNFGKLTKRQKDILAELDQNFTDARIYTAAWELSETAQEQKNNAKQAKRWLRAANKNILTASEFNAFDVVDVAHLTAQIDLIIKGL